MSKNAKLSYKAQVIMYREMRVLSLISSDIYPSPFLFYFRGSYGVLSPPFGESIAKKS
jgi:hypothetical protein